MPKAWPWAMTTPTSNPCTCWLAMLRQDDGPRALLQRAGANVLGLQASAPKAAVKRLPQVQGQEQVQVGPELGRVLQATEKEAIKRGDQFIASELFLLALADSKGEAAEIAKDNGLTRKSLEAAINAVRGGQKVDSAEAEGQREALKKYCLDLTERARAGQARPGDRPRRRNPPRHPGAAAPHQEQPGADRRARRGQDRHRRGPGPAHRRRRGARNACKGKRVLVAGHGARCWPVPSTAASSRSA